MRQEMGEGRAAAVGADLGTPAEAAGRGRGASAEVPYSIRQAEVCIRSFWSAVIHISTWLPTTFKLKSMLKVLYICRTTGQ